MSPGEYRCKLSLYFQTINGSAWATKWIDLPFVPNAGMKICGVTDIVDDIEELSDVTVEEVAWVHGPDRGYFVIRCEPEDYRFVMDDVPIEQLFKEQIGEDWTIESLRVAEKTNGHVAG
jgi:hypothetical protein